jgi:hypothetical protein
MSLTLKQMLKKTDGERHARAAFVKISKMKTGYLANGLGYVACQSYSTHNIGPDGRPVRKTTRNHHVTVYTFIDKKLHVHCACSCEDNTFRWEFANTQKNASEIEYSNGEPPSTTNPKLRVSLCKHMIALADKIRPKLPPGTL